MSSPAPRRERLLFEHDLAPSLRLRGSLAYDPGGANYFTGRDETRGYDVSVTPVSIQNGMVMMTSFSGLRMLIQTASRFSPKTLDVIRPTQAQLDDLIARVLRKNHLTRPTPVPGAPALTNKPF